MSAAVAAAAAAASLSRRSSTTTSTARSASDGFYYCPPLSPPVVRAPLSNRYELRKRCDWDNFRQYLRSRRPTLSPARCSGANVVEFLSYLDDFGQTKFHAAPCPNFGRRYPADPDGCDCPLRQPWSSLDGLVSRLRVAFVENGGNPATNPFNAVDVRGYLIGVRDSQDRSRGIDRR